VALDPVEVAANWYGKDANWSEGALPLAKLTYVTNLLCSLDRKAENICRGHGPVDSESESCKTLTRAGHRGGCAVASQVLTKLHHPFDDEVLSM
jgi:hypothetical protein